MGLVLEENYHTSSSNEVPVSDHRQVIDPREAYNKFLFVLPTHLAQENGSGDMCMELLTQSGLCRSLCDNTTTGAESIRIFIGRDAQLVW